MPGQRRAVDFGMVAAVFETTAEAVVTTAAAPVGKTATARTMMMLSVTTAVQAGQFSVPQPR